MLDKLEVGKTYVFKDEECRQGYFYHSAGNHKRVKEHYNQGFTLESVDDLGGLIQSSCVICASEIKYFKLKEENKMLKPDDKVQVEMTALEAVVLRELLGKTLGVTFEGCYDSLCEDDRLPKYISSNVYSFYNYEDLFKLYKDSSFVLWAKAQFKSPHQEKIKQLEKEIHEKASELAKLKMEG